MYYRRLTVKAYRKGRDFELEVAKQLRAAGFKSAKRTPRSGAIEGLESDLLVSELPFVWELKNQQQWDIKGYWDQVMAAVQGTNKIPVVVAKKNNQAPIVMMKLADWILLCQRAFIENKLPISTGKGAYTKHMQLNK